MSSECDLPPIIALTIVFIVGAYPESTSAQVCQEPLSAPTTSSSAGSSSVESCPPSEPPLPPPPPPSPSIPLDDEFTQLNYEWESRVGDYNGDGYRDVYIRRLTGHPDNGVVFEGVGKGKEGGRFDLVPYSASVYAAARAMPALDVVSAGNDVDFDGVVDPTVYADNPVAGLTYDHSFLSSGRQYDRYPRGIVVYDESLEKYEDDLREADIDPTYFDNAKQPDEEGYQVTLVVERTYCYTFFGPRFCFPCRAGIRARLYTDYYSQS